MNFIPAQPYTGGHSPAQTQSTAVQPIHPGDVLWTWCSHCMERTDHRWTGYKLVCLACNPEGK